MVTAYQVTQFQKQRAIQERKAFDDRAAQNAVSGDDEYLVSRVTSTITDRRWLTQSGNYVYPEDMTNEHLIRTAKMLAEGRNKRPGCSGRSNAQWLEIFKNELARRGLLDKLVYVKEEAQKT